MKLIFSLLWSLSAAVPQAHAKQWPCPDFGECHGTVVVGACEGFLYLTYGKTPQLQGRGGFWEADYPRPCALSFRFGRQLVRRTFDQKRCDEFVDLFERAVSDFPKRALATDPLTQCESSQQRGLVVVAHSERNFRDGVWRPLVRESVAPVGFGSCRVVEADQLLVCPELGQKERLWLRELVEQVGWKVRGRPLVQLPQKDALKLAPGDRMRGNK